MLEANMVARDGGGKLNPNPKSDQILDALKRLGMIVGVVQELGMDISGDSMNQRLRVIEDSPDVKIAKPTSLLTVLDNTPTDIYKMCEDIEIAIKNIREMLF